MFLSLSLSESDKLLLRLHAHAATVLVFFFFLIFPPFFSPCIDTYSITLKPCTASLHCEPQIKRFHRIAISFFFTEELRSRIYRLMSNTQHTVLFWRTMNNAISCFGRGGVGHLSADIKCTQSRAVESQRSAH